MFYLAKSQNTQVKDNSCAGILTLFVKPIAQGKRLDATVFFFFLSHSLIYILVTYCAVSCESLFGRGENRWNILF